jgi:hypothetical protein
MAMERTSARPDEVDRGVLHGELRAEVAVHPLDERVLVRDGALGDEVVDVVRPVLDRGVADARALQRHELDDGAVERVAGVRRGGAALDVVHGRSLVRDDERALELAHVLRVDPEVGLEGDLHVRALRHVDERPSRPHGAVQRRELVVLGRDDGAEPLAHQLRLLLQALIHGEEDHALRLEVLADGVVHDLGLVLRRHAGEELALRLGDAEPVERVLDLLRHLVPRALFAARRLEVVEDLLELDVVEHRRVAPARHRLREEDLVGVPAEVEHPLGLALDVADLLDDGEVEPLAGLEHGHLVVVEAVLVVLGDVAGLAARGGGGVEGAVAGRRRVDGSVHGVVGSHGASSAPAAAGWSHS